MSIKLQIKVIPNSSKDEVVGWLDKQLKIKVRAQAEKGKANKAVIELLAKTIGLKKSQIVICSGLTNSYKELEIQGVTNEQISRRLKNFV